MLDEEKVELAALESSKIFINILANRFISALTEKALSVKIEEKERLVIIGRKIGIEEIIQATDRRIAELKEKKKREEGK